VLAAGTAISALAVRRHADLIQINQPALAALPGPSGIPRIVVAHSCVETWWRALREGPAPAAFAWQTDLVGRGLRGADAVVCPSHAFSAAVAAAYGLPRPPAVVLNGRSALASASGALHDFALTCGRLWDEAKNVATLDRAAALLGVPFKAAGPLAGPHGERVELHHLHALGRVEPQTLAGCLGARPVFVSAARYEPFGLAVLEAAQAGCPLVLSDIPTHRELWDGAASFVDPLDATAFARAIEALIGDMRLRLGQGDLARRRAQDHTPDRMAAGMAGLYRRALDAQRRAAA
jgi:glycosyltransferase involved in cell wall biosynthesis